MNSEMINIELREVSEEIRARELAEKAELFEEARAEAFARWMAYMEGMYAAYSYEDE